MKSSRGPKRNPAKQLRADPAKTRAWQDRSRDAARQRELEAAVKASAPLRRRAEKTRPGANGFTQRVFVLYGRHCLACPGKRRARAVHAHHVIPKRTIEARGDDFARDHAYDAKNGLPVCFRCHEKHENAVVRIPRARLRPEHFEWALEHGFGWFIDDARVYPPGAEAAA